MSKYLGMKQQQYAAYTRHFNRYLNQLTIAEDENQIETIYAKIRRMAENGFKPAMDLLDAENGNVVTLFPNAPVVEDAIENLSAMNEIAGLAIAANKIETDGEFDLGELSFNSADGVHDDTLELTEANLVNAPSAQKLDHPMMAAVKKAGASLAHGAKEFVGGGIDHYRDLGKAVFGIGKSLLGKKDDQPKQSLADRVKAVGESISQNKEAFISVAATAALSFGAKAALTALAGTVTPAWLIAAVPAALLTSAMEVRKQYRAAELEKDRVDFAEKLIAEKGHTVPDLDDAMMPREDLLKLEAEHKKALIDEVLKGVSASAYDRRANYSVMQKVGASLHDLVRGDAWKQVKDNGGLARVLGRGILGAGSMAGVMSALMGHHGAAQQKVPAAPKMPVPVVGHDIPASDVAPAVKLEVTAPAPAPVVDHHAAAVAHDAPLPKSVPVDFSHMSAMEHAEALAKNSHDKLVLDSLRAAKAGQAWGKLNLAYFANNGLHGMDVDHKLAADLARPLAEQGNANAVKFMNEMHASFTPKHVDVDAVKTVAKTGAKIVQDMPKGDVTVPAVEAVKPLPLNVVAEFNVDSSFNPDGNSRGFEKLSGPGNDFKAATGDAAQLDIVTSSTHKVSLVSQLCNGETLLMFKRRALEGLSGLRSLAESWVQAGSNAGITADVVPQGVNISLANGQTVVGTGPINEMLTPGKATCDAWVAANDGFAQGATTEFPTFVANDQVAVLLAANGPK